MIRRRRPSSPLPRLVFLTLACLAIALRILIPPGFMAGAPTNNLPFPIVLCTAQGPITIEAGQPIPGHDEQAPGAAHDSPCAFAGAALTAPPPSPVEVDRPTLLAYRTPVARLASSPAPGRGLAAPPPPSTGPPTTLI